jgi:tripartite-type tricarboxylate transporter receptor subunit TctC
VHVPFRSGPDMVNCVASGHCQLMFISLTTALPRVQEGKLRVLAVTSPQRLALMPEVPTMIEAGFPGLTSDAWIGLFAPAGTPDEIVQAVSRATRSALATPEVRDAFGRFGGDAIGSTPAEFARLVAADMERWGRIVRQAGITVE